MKPTLPMLSSASLLSKKSRWGKRAARWGWVGASWLAEHTHATLRQANMQRWEVKERLVNPKTIFRFPHVDWNRFCFAVIVPPAHAGRDKMTLIWSFSSCSFKWLSNMVFLVRNSVSLIFLTQTAEAWTGGLITASFNVMFYEMWTYSLRLDSLVRVTSVWKLRIFWHSEVLIQFCVYTPVICLSAIP